MRSKLIHTTFILCISSMILAGCGTISKSEQKKEVNSFVNKANQKEKSITKDLNLFVDVFSEFDDEGGGSGSVNLSALSDRSKALKKDYNSIHTDLGKMKSPKGLPSDVTALLNNGIKEISNAYLQRSQGLDSLINYTKSLESNDLIDFQQNMAKTQSELEDGAQKMKEASKKVGLIK